MTKLVKIGLALLLVMTAFVPFVAANDGAQETNGYLYVQLACRSPQIGGEFSLAPVVVSASFTDAARVDVGFVEKYVKYVGPVKVEQFRPDGQTDLQVEPGTYLLAMKDGNGGQPEYALVTVGMGEKETVVFLGHGITAAEMSTAQPVIVVTEATYGAITVITPATPATVVPAGHHHHGYIVHYEGNVNKHYGCGHADVYVNGQGYDFDYGGMYQYTPGTPAVTTGAVIDVKAQVQALVDQGVQNMVFNNAANPGGIFDTEGNLLTQIADPAYGTLKTATIKYTVDGGAVKTVSGQEHQTLSLV